MTSIRTVEPGDLPFLIEMLCEAAFPPATERPPLGDALDDPRLSRWLEGWGRHGDTGVAAEDESGPIGAAWCRLFDDADLRLRGVIDDVTPELIVGVRPDKRGRGVGGRLLAELLERVATAGFERISLGVGKTNPAIRLYQRLGFVELHDGRRPCTMYRTLP